MKRLKRSHVLLLAAAAIAATIAVVGCGQNPLTTAPDGDNDVAGLELKRGNPAIEAAIKIQDRNTPQLLEISGVVGTAIGVAGGEPVIKVYTNGTDPGLVPAELEGLRVVAEETGVIVAFKGPPGGGNPGGNGGVSHTAMQETPIQLGTSGSPADDIANGYCCGGTLGSLVQIGGNQYILSNSHVFAGDVVSGGNGSTSSIGDDIIQPGLIDASCGSGANQVVADLSSLSTIYPPNSTPNIDASIAQVRAGQVRSDGSILEIGTLSSSTVAAFVGQNVKKSGRTTGLTRSRVEGLNATINVGYSDECAGGSFTKQFTGQIIIRNKGSKYLNSGDSGSLMVEDVDTNPRAVGLLYAGSSSIAVANPINDVLNHFNASMVGN